MNSTIRFFDKETFKAALDLLQANGICDFEVENDEGNVDHEDGMDGDHASALASVYGSDDSGMDMYDTRCECED